MSDLINPVTLRQIPDAVKTVLKQFSSYDDPCFVLLYSDAQHATKNEVLEQVIENNSGEASAWFHLGQNISFCYLLCNHYNANFIAFDLSDSLIEQGHTAKVSVFRHNCIGDVFTTYRWNTTQLLELVASNDDVSINDFCDERHWQGIDHYIAADQAEGVYVEEAQQENGKSANSEHGEYLPAPLQQLDSFITNLPQGSALWQYVLTGEYQGDGSLEQSLIDLDSVLLLLHAKRYSADFYRHILRCCHYDSIPCQQEILPSLDTILRPLYAVLLADKHNTINQQRFMRVVDIFFHLFDQQDLPTALRSVMVQDADTACIGAFEYEQRYSLPDEASANSISAKTKQQIDDIIDSLDSYYSCDHQDYQQIEQVFASNRHAFNHQLWQRDDEEEQTLCRLIGAILLNVERANQQCDDYSEALINWVRQGVQQDVIAQFEQHSKQPSERLNAWLVQGQVDSLPALIEELKAKLDSDSPYEYTAKLGVVQPEYGLFSSVRIFRPLLATCYWLFKATQDDFAKRVVMLCAALAPQATISSMAKLYRQSLHGFATSELQTAFLTQLGELEIAHSDRFAFQAALAVQNDIGELETLVHRYAQLEQSEREDYNKAINNLSSYERDNFYLNVQRLHPTLNTPLPSYRDIVIGEVMCSVSVDDSTIELDQLTETAKRFLDGELSFNQFHNQLQGSIDINQFELPPEYYDQQAPKILPQILSTQDSDELLRWIQLFCCKPAQSKFSWFKAFRRHTTHNKQLQATLLEHLFFEQVLHEGNLSFKDRHEIEIDDLTPDWLKYWQDYQRRMARKVKTA